MTTVGRKHHGMYRSPTHQSWRAMRQRCTDPARPTFKLYGGRGITVCERWNTSFAAFLEDMGQRPKGMSLDRLDNDGPYSPDNCRWATVKEQCNNRKTNRRIEFRGETRTLKQWAELYGINKGTLRHRLDRGWTIERAFGDAAPVDRPQEQNHD